ncbi:MAG: glycoside hydrolase family 3 C-terminal domain-containing protein, partial [Opitutales bacterium]
TPPLTADYCLGTISDDGSRLYVDGKLVSNNWGTHGMFQTVGRVALEAGRSYDIRIDYYEGGGGSGVKLVWQDPATAHPAPALAEAVEAASKADVVIMCVGNTADFEGEAKDVAGFDMPLGQEALIEAVAAVNKHVAVVIYGGTAQKVTGWVDDVSALLDAYYPGQEGGDALARILFGEVNPSGKLPFSFIQDASQSPATGHYMDSDLRVPYDEGVFVGYKWYETHGVTPLFPFGYGLSYTTYAYSNLKVTKTGEWTASVSIDVTNTGERAGAEVVQLYVGQDHPSEPRPMRELRGFGKVFLTPGQTQTVTIPLDYRSFRYWDEAANAWRADSDTFTICVGASSEDIRAKGTLSF